MFNICDACKRPNPAEIAQIQVERGELVASKLGLSLRSRQRDLFILCSDCGTLALSAMRHVIEHGGTVARQAEAS